MEFIENNYVWIIVIGVVLLMTVIGYFADKMETKEEKPKKKKEKKNQILDSVPEVEEQQTDNELPPEWDETKKVVDDEQEIMNIEGTANTNEWNELPEVNENLITDDNSGINFDNNEWQMDTNETSAEIDNHEEDNNLSFEVPEVQFENVEESNEELVGSEEQIDEMLVDQPVEIEESIEETIPEQIDELNNLEITLPNIEALNVEENENDEDVWKF